MALIGFVGIDPGKTTGWSWVTVDTDIKQITADKGLRLGMDKTDELLDMMVQSEKKYTLICEDFTLFSRLALAQSGSNMPASQVIGMVKSAVRRSAGRIELVMQSSKDNKQRAKASGREIPNNHKVSHDVAAYNHVFSYLLEKNIIKNRMFWK